MQTGWKFVLVLLLATILCLRCANSTKTKTKLLKKIWHSEQHKAAHPKTLTGQKKNAVQPVQAMPQPSSEQVAAMQNPESLQPSETEELNQLQNYNKQYINNEMAAETALLADQGIDDDSALKISNMAALPDGVPPGSNAAIKAKISSAHASHGTSSGPSQASQSSQASPGGYDPNAYLYDANSWPEYTIHDSDYSNFRSVEMNNMNGENTDMPIYKPSRRPNMAGYPNMGNEEGMEYQGPKFPQEKEDDSQFNDEYKQENGEASHKKPFSEEAKQENGESLQQKKPFHDEAKQEKGEALQQKPKSEGSPLSVKDEGVTSAIGDAKPAKSESNSKQALAPAQQSLKGAGSKADGNAPTAKDAPSQQQQQQQQQQQPQAKAIPAKLAESVAQAAASLPPKTIASLVSSLVGGGKAVGTTAGKVLGQGQVQKNIAGGVPQSLIPQDINPAEEQTQVATQLHKVAKPRKA